MVLCAVFGCNNRSERDKDVSYYKIPSVITHTHDERDRQLSTERRDYWIAAISREDLTVEVLESDSKTDYRVCSRHFQSGKPAKLYDKTSPDWVPSINLGHLKRPQQQVEVNNAKEDLKIISQEAFELEILHCAKGKCKCSEEIKALKEELKSCHATINELSTRLQEQLPPFFEESVKDDNFVLYYTGLPNVKVLKAIFKHVLKTMPSERINKLTPFQEFMCTLQKLISNTPLQGLAYQFGVSKATISRIFSRWLIQMDI